MPHNPFASLSRNFVRNPLGVIALFLVLVYGMAGLVVVGGRLSPTSEIILVAFLALFPVLVLGAFCVLVTRHAEKLYAPSDFADESNFMLLRQRREQSSGSANRIRQWLAASPDNRAALAAWLTSLGLPVSATIFLQGSQYQALHEAAVIDLAIPEQEP